MSGYINTPKARIEQGVARGWSDERIAREARVPLDAVIAGREWLEALVSDDPPFVVEPPAVVQRRRRQAAALKRMEHRRLLAELERERRIVARNAWSSPERAYQRASHAAWKRLYRARKAAA